MRWTNSTCSAAGIPKREEEDGVSTEYTYGRQASINGRFVFVFDQLIAEASEGGIPLSTIARLKKCCGRDKERGKNEWIGEFCGMCLTSGALVHSEMIAGFIGSEWTRVICRRLQKRVAASPCVSFFSV